MWASLSAAVFFHWITLIAGSAAKAVTQDTGLNQFAGLINMVNSSIRLGNIDIEGGEAL